MRSLIMLTLGIETSGRAGSIALLKDGLLLEEVTLSATGRRHARTLVPEIGNLLSTHHFTSMDVNLVAVSVGPGSFTGLRVGVTCAKTFAYAVNCNIIGVDTFLAVATASPNTTHQVWVIEDALRGDISAGKYHCLESGWTCSTEPSLVSLEEWRSQVKDIPVSGPGVSKLKDQLSGLSLVDEDFREPQARFIAQVGEQLFRQGHKDDPWSLEPRYMRRSAAEEKAESSAS